MSDIKISYTSKKIIDALGDIKTGILTVPTFQRGYDWTASDLTNFWESVLIRREPIGSFVIWKSNENTLQGDSNKVFNQLSPKETESPEYYYLIDGQQRMTSFAMPFLMHIKNDATFITKSKNVYITFDKKENKVKFKNDKKDTHPPTHIHISKLFLDEKEFKKLLKGQKILWKLDDEQKDEYKDELNALHTRLHDNLEAGVVQISSAKIDSVIDIFNLINTKGKKLSPFDIVHSSFVKEKVNLTKILDKSMKDANELLAKSGNKDIPNWGIPKGDLLTTAFGIFEKVFTASSMKKKAQDKVNVVSIEKIIKEELDNVLFKTIRFLHNLGFRGHGSLPSKSYIYITAYVFSKSGSSDAEIKELLTQYFKNAIICKRHVSGSEGIKEIGITDDVEALVLLKEFDQTKFTWINESTNTMDIDDILSSKYNGTNALSKYITAWMIANLKSFNSGNLVKIDGKDDFKLNLHHIFPQAFIETNKLDEEGQYKDSLANITPLSKDENIDLSDEDPAVYLKGVGDAQLKLALMNKEFDNFIKFIEERAKAILKEAFDKTPETK